MTLRQDDRGLRDESLSDQTSGKSPVEIGILLFYH